MNARCVLLWCLLSTLILTENSPAQGQEFAFALNVFPDATVGIQNVSDQAWLVESYALFSTDGLLDFNAWQSIDEQFRDDPAQIRLLLGQDFPKPGHPFGVVQGSGPAGLGEFLPLPVWNPDLMIPIGRPLGPDLAAARAAVESLGFLWEIHHGFDQWGGPVVFVPEPCTLTLLFLAVPTALFFRMNWSRQAAKLGYVRTRVSSLT